MKNFLGVDIGGTFTKVGILNENGEIISFVEYDTPGGGVDAEIALIGEIIGFLGISPDSIDAIGVGIPGPVDRNGIVHNPPNLKGWGEADFAKYLSEFLKFPKYKIIVGNDANFAALAEYRFGNGAKADPMVLITLGTGVGGAVIIGGEPMLGRDGFAAELGHIVIEPDGPRCGCGRRGCAESLISHKGIVRIAWDILRRDKGSIMWNMIGSNFDELTPLTIQKAADIGDPAANKVLKIISRYLAIFLADLIDIFNPERIVVGGGISRWGEPLLGPARKEAKKQALKYLSKDVKIVRAKFYQRAGVIGAATASMKI